MKRFEKRVVLANSFGALGYVALFVTWALFVSIVLMALMDVSVIQLPTDNLVQPSEDQSNPSGMTITVAYLVTGLAVIASLFVVVALPYLIGRWGAKLNRMILAIAKVTLSHRTLFAGKLLMLSIPAIGMYTASFFLPPENTEAFAVSVLGSVMTVVAVVVFGLQHVVARRLNVNIKKIW